MKRITTLLLAAAMLCGANSVAEAAEIKVNGFWQISGVYSDNLGFLNNSAADLQRNAKSPVNGMAHNSNEFDVLQRILVSMDIVNSENLQAKLALYVPQSGTWGAGSFAAGGGSLNGPTDLLLALAYVDWFVPSTDIKIRMGLQESSSPSYINLPTNPVYNQTAPGIRVTIPVNENITFDAQWLRLLDTPTAVALGAANNTSVNADYFTVQVPMNFNTWSITPWISYAKKVADLDYAHPGFMNGLGEDTYWVGMTSLFRMFDPITFGFDFVYGQAHSDYNGASIFGSTNNVYERASNFDGEGWLVDGHVSYAHQYGLTKLTAWYSQGADKNGNDGRFGTIVPTWITGSAYYMQDIYHTPDFLPCTDATGPNGTWALMLSHLNFPLTSNLFLGAQVLYLHGTNHPNNARLRGYEFDPTYLTSQDSLVEFSFWTRHHIMKDLMVSYEFNYIMQNFDEDLWFSDRERANGAKFEDGFRTNISFFYTF